MTCEDGTQKRLRTCDFPPNSTHGRDCAGDNHEDKTCSKGACPGNKQSFGPTLPSNDANGKRFLISLSNNATCTVIMPMSII